MRRSLSLRKETLAELTPEELTAVVGGTLDTGRSADVVCFSDDGRSCSECYVTFEGPTLLRCGGS